MIQLGGPVFGEWRDPAEWIAEVRKWGYRAAYCPLKPDADDATVRAFAQAAERADIVIAEVGAWSNPQSSDPAKRAAALELCKRSLDLAERIGARCCVNVAGSRGPRWDGPYAADLSDETFDMVVATTREIIDAVRPTRSCYTLETMPWMVPDSVDCYVRLIRAIDRPGFGVHFDPVNLICSPQLYFANSVLIRDAITRLGPHLKSCHAKDILLQEKLTVHLDEVRPGLGVLDYRSLLKELNRLSFDVPLMLEHLPDAADYEQGAAYIRSVAQEVTVSL
jgi:sugar phosphate isomerase/epimerase